MKIIYINDRGGVSVIHPTPEILETYGIQAVAEKDVPAGKPFKIINAADLPTRDTRAAWAVDPATLTDGIGGNSSEFPPAV